MKTMPPQKPGKSNPRIRTPEDLLRAVRSRWGILAFSYDLAGPLENNVKAWKVITEEEDSLAINWHELTGTLWLNPPFSYIKPWARKCAESIASAQQHQRIFLLVPASVGSSWFRDYVYGKARVYFLTARINFDGRGLYPKDCLLAVYGEEPGIEFWDWRK